MTFYELWVYIAELLLGANNYSLIGGIADLVFIVFTLVLVVILFLLPFLTVYVVFNYIRSLRWGRI
jgi:hypothetical protein